MKPSIVEALDLVQFFGAFRCQRNALDRALAVKHRRLGAAVPLVLRGPGERPWRVYLVRPLTEPPEDDDGWS